jgi:hypothetical protein
MTGLIYDYQYCWLLIKLHAVNLIGRVNRWKEGQIGDTKSLFFDNHYILSPKSVLVWHGMDKGIKEIISNLQGYFGKLSQM